MKLSELFESKAHSSSEVKDWDGLLDAGVLPFTLQINYNAQDGGTDKVPYGDGDSDLNHGIDVEVISVASASEVKVTDADENIIKTFPAGTDVAKLPGYKAEMEKFFKEVAVDAANE